MSSNSIDNRPIGRQDANDQLIPDSFIDEAFQGDYMGGANLIYKGFARPGVQTSEDKWQIAFLTYDGNNNITSITWPINSIGVASNDYEFEWDDRALYTYV